MNIIKCHKNENGDTIGYTLKSIGNAKVYLSKSIASSVSSMIHNAVLDEYGEFNPIEGYIFETITDTDRQHILSDKSKVKEHSYINTSKLHDFRKKKTIKSVYRDIEDKYKITNICDDDGESLYYLCATLLEDYEMKRANYEAYLEVGMNARFMMELRRNAILIMGEGLEDFYENHKYCETLEDIKELRIKYLKNANDEYIDLNWQYYYLVRINLGRKKTEGFIFDFESCYADGDWRKQTNPQDYEEEFRYVHSYEGIMEQIRREYGSVNE